MNPKGIILTGGPNSAYEADSPTYDKELFELGIPVLGICYGSQLMMHLLGGTVEKAPVREYGKIEVTVDTTSQLFTDISEKTICWMSHNDYISKAAPEFDIIAHTADCPVAAVQNVEKNYMQHNSIRKYFTHRKERRCFLTSYIMYVAAQVTGRWILSWKLNQSNPRESRRRKSALRTVWWCGFLCGSSYAFKGSRLTAYLCVRRSRTSPQNEGDEVEAIFGPEGNYELNFIRVNAQERFYAKLKGVEDPEAKRKIIGEEFIRVFEEEAKNRSSRFPCTGNDLSGYRRERTWR